MEYFKWSWQDLMDVPIPAYFVIVDIVSKIEEEKEKAHKKAMRKR